MYVCKVCSYQLPIDAGSGQRHLFGRRELRREVRREVWREVVVEVVVVFEVVVLVFEVVVVVFKVVGVVLVFEVVFGGAGAEKIRSFVSPDTSSWST